MYVHKHISIYVCVLVIKQIKVAGIYTYICICSAWSKARWQVYISVYINLSIFIHICIHVYIHIDINTYSCMSIYTYVHRYIFIYIHVSAGHGARQKGIAMYRNICIFERIYTYVCIHIDI